MARTGTRERPGLAAALERHAAPWHLEPAPIAGWYVLDAGGRLVTWTASERDALELVALAGELEPAGSPGG